MRFALKKRYTLTLEDDPIIYPLVELATEMPTFSFSEIESFVSQMGQFRPLGVFVDVHLGIAQNGIDVIPRIKERWPYIPLIVMTSDLSEDLVSKALTNGADDFILKPINLKELSSRFQIRSRDLSLKQSSQSITLGQLTLNSAQRSLHYNKKRVPLSPLSAKLFECFFQSRGTTLTKDFLKRNAWPGSVIVQDNTLEKKIHEMRTQLKELGANAEIKNIFNQGYQLIATEAQVSHE
jgi:two-component system OmpR family response regulator